MTDLALVSTESLVEELKTRSDAIVFARCRDRAQQGTAFMMTFSGNRATCLGLLDILQGRIRSVMDSDADTDEPGMEF